MLDSLMTNGKCALQKALRVIIAYLAYNRADYNVRTSNANSEVVGI